MRDPMLPVSPMSNDGSLWHKPTSAPAGLDCCSRPLADLRKVRFQAVEAEVTSGLGGFATVRFRLMDLRSGRLRAGCFRPITVVALTGMLEVMMRHFRTSDACPEANIR